MAPPPPPSASDNGSAGGKRKRRPAGTPDPDAEVVALSPKTLMESDRYVCEICNQGFQRDQNLQMHRRRHKVPWKLLKRENPEVRKRVFVCPEPACLHHDPRHALGDLVGIKKHYRRKHSDHRQWACARCSKAYAVHSDYKAHLKTCGTRGHSCDCGRVFSRVESFIEHQDICNATRPAVAPSTASAPPGVPPPVWLGLTVIPPPAGGGFAGASQLHHGQDPELIQLLPASASSHRSSPPPPSPPSDDAASMQLHLSIGLCGPPQAAAAAAEEKRAADEARRQARRQMEAAEAEFVEARRMRQEARVELCKAQLLRYRAAEQVSRTLMQITCGSCKMGWPLYSPASNALAFGLRCAPATGGGDNYHGRSRRDDCTGGASEV